jgi:hypothetical protein
MDPFVEEIEIICANCSFPTVTEYDDQGRVKSFQELVGPKTYEEATAAGWLDHGLGLYCPQCSLRYLEDKERTEDDQAGAVFDFSSVVDQTILKALAPDISDQTIDIFIKVFKFDRLSKVRVRAGLGPLEPLGIPVPENEHQAAEIIKLSELLKERAFELSKGAAKK